MTDRWWVTPTAFAFGTETRNHRDRKYYWLLLPDHQVFEIYHDSISNVWVLDVVQV